MLDALAGLPAYIKYVAITVVPWIELRGSVPLAVQQGETIYIPLIAIANCLVFFPTYFILGWVYELIPEDTWLHRRLESTREKARPLVEKYGFIGLAIFIGVPLPGTGAYSGSAAAWLLGMAWHMAFAAVVLGVLIALAIVWGLSIAVASGWRAWG